MKDYSKDRHYVYKVTDKTTGEFYWGSRSAPCAPEDDSKYMGSMCGWKPDKKNLIKGVIVEYPDRATAYKVEEMLIILDWDNPLNRNYRRKDSFHSYGVPLSLGRKLSEETRKRIGDGNRGKKRSFSDEHRERLGAWQRGKKKKPWSEETRKKILEGRQRAKEHKNT